MADLQLEYIHAHCIYIYVYVHINRYYMNMYSIHYHSEGRNPTVQTKNVPGDDSDDDDLNWSKLVSCKVNFLGSNNAGRFQCEGIDSD